MNKVLSATAMLAIVLWGSFVFSIGHTSPLNGQASDALTLTDSGLKQMLENMGLDPKPLSKGYLIAIKRDGWTYNVQLVLSSDATKIGFNSNLGKVEDPDSVTAQQWRALLISNGDIDPSYFYFDDKLKKLYLHRALDNHGLTASYLRVQIDNFCGNLKGTADLWKFTK